MRANSRALLTLAAVCMSVALICIAIDSASQDYRAELLISLAGTLIADGCCAVTFARGSGVARFGAAMIALPSLFIIWDFLRRAPAAFG
jgi:hypothetical protein